MKNFIIQSIFLAVRNSHVEPGLQLMDDKQLLTLRKYDGGLVLSTDDVRAGALPASRDRGGGKIKIRGAKLKTSVELDPNFHSS